MIKLVKEVKTYNSYHLAIDYDVLGELFYQTIEPYGGWDSELRVSEIYKKVGLKGKLIIKLHRWHWKRRRG